MMMYKRFKIFGLILLSTAAAFQLASNLAVAVPVQVTETFDVDPLWDGFNNTTGNNSYGFSNTNNTGAASGSGEVGGAVGNMPRSYYAADVGSLDASTDVLSMQGTAYIDVGPTGDDGQHFWGWFDKDDLGGGFRPDNFIGIYSLRDPPYQLRLLWHVNGSSNDVAVLVPEIVPEQSFTYDLTFDPNANGGNGSLTAFTSAGGYSVTLNLPAGRKDDFNNFDRFGMLSEYPVPTIVPAVVFHDDITYTTNDSVLFPLGDFNRDSFVDSADFTIMKTNWLTAGNEINAGGEVTGDGIVDLRDFKLFKEELFMGPGSGSLAGIPEPSTAALLLLAVPVWFVRSRGGRVLRLHAV